MNIPPRTHKYLFWLNLGLLSAFFAEVVSGSELFPFFNFWGIVALIPLYMLHTLLLAAIVFRKGRPTLYVLYFAGTLFGLYEAYLTKILWQPDWGETAVTFAGLAVFEILVLVFFWHVWMSFIFPLLAAETWLTNSNEILSWFPFRWQNLFGRRRGWMILAILGGFFVTINAPDPWTTLLSGLGSILVLGLTGGLWRRLTRGQNYTIEALMPTRREFTFLAFWLLGLYLFMGFLMRPEAFPPLLGHISIWVLYATCIFLLSRALKNSRQSTPREPAPVSQAPLGFWKWGLALYVAVSVLTELLLLVLPLADLIVLIGWFGIALLGLSMFIVYSLKLLHTRRTWVKDEPIAANDPARQRAGKADAETEARG